MSEQAIVLNRFDKTDTTYVKGIALICMMVRHLFTAEHLEADCFFPLSEGAVVGAICEFCQMSLGMFIFLSGVGMFYSKTGFKRTVSRVFSLYSKMWAVMIILCIPVMLIRGMYTFNVVELLKNITGINTSYNSSWWYVILYAEFVIAEALLSKFLKNGSVLRHILIFVFMAAVSIVTHHWVMPWAREVGNGILSILVSQVYQFCVYGFIFLLGFYAARYGLMDKLVGLITRCKRWVCLILGVVILVADVLVGHFVRPYINFLFLEWLLVPVFIIGVLMIRKSVPQTIVTKGILWLGEYSVWMWFIHNIFIDYLRPVAYLPKIPVLIVLWIILLTILPALLMNFLYGLPGKLKKKKQTNAGA